MIYIKTQYLEHGFNEVGDFDALEHEDEDSNGDGG